MHAIILQKSSLVPCKNTIHKGQKQECLQSTVIDINAEDIKTKIVNLIHSLESHLQDQSRSKAKVPHARRE